MIFTQNELRALKAFYAGVPARKIRPQFGDPWRVVAKHRNLPKDQYEAVKASLAQLEENSDPHVSDPAGALTNGERS